MDRRDGSNCLRHKEDRRRDSDNRRRQGTTCVGREEKRQSRVASYVRDGVNLHRGKANLVEPVASAVAAASAAVPSARKERSLGAADR